MCSKRRPQAGFRCVYISNGNATPEVLDYLQPYLVGYKIDLKSMNDKHYRQLGTTLAARARRHSDGESARPVDGDRHAGGAGF